MQNLVNGAPSREDVCDGMARVELTERGDVGAVHVGVHQDDSRTEAGQCDRQVDRNGRSSNAPLAAADNELLRRSARRAGVARARSSDECSELVGLVVHGEWSVVSGQWAPSLIVHN
jgi:hypothetical protein